MTIMRVLCNGGERGGVLLGVMLLTMLLTAISVTMSLSGQTELLVARTDESAAQAHAAAEAGLNHAVDVTLTHLQQWERHGYGSASDAVTGLLVGPDGITGSPAADVDNGSLEELGLARPPATVPLANVYGTSYQVRVFDEDDPTRGLLLSPADTVRIGENGTPASDANTGVVVQSIGYGPAATMVTLEATLGAEGIPALLVNGSLAVSGRARLDGTAGSIHANERLNVRGRPRISGNATATERYTESGRPRIGGVSGAGYAPLTVPEVRAVDYRPDADFIMTPDGQVTDPASVVLCDASTVGDACADAYGWTFNGAARGAGPAGGRWELTNAQHPGGTFYIEGEARISANPGSADDPVPLTVIAERSIDVSGRPHTVPDTQGLAFVTDMDLRLRGRGRYTLAGQILVHEQIRIERRPTINGQITVEDAPSVGRLVRRNRVGGRSTITYNGGLGTRLAVTAWREVR